jgi:WXG100 family type VII secretion target
MAGDIIKMDYSDMQDMAKTFQQSSQQLRETMQEMKAIAETLEGGALLGRGGQAFVQAINGKLNKSITKLDEKMNELQKDVLSAMKDMQQADNTSKGMF